MQEITSTRETVHGLLRLDGDNLVLQWRSSRTTERVDLTRWKNIAGVSTDHEIAPVKEVILRRC